MTAVILAAGWWAKTWFRPYADGRMVGENMVSPVRDQCLFDYCVNFLDILADRVVVVAGFEHEKVSHYFALHYPHVTVLTTTYTTSGNLGTLATALPHINDDLLVMNSDHIYARSRESRFIFKIFQGMDGLKLTTNTIYLSQNQNSQKIHKNISEYIHQHFTFY